MNAGKLGDWGNWEIRRFGRLGKIVTCGKKIRTSWNPGGFGRLGRLRDWEIREIREVGGSGKNGCFGKMVMCCRSGKRCRGEDGGGRRIGKLKLGGFRRLEDSGAWEVPEIGRFEGFGRLGRFGKLEDSVDWETWEIGGNRYMWRK